MQWHSWSEFFNMGGYAFYVWGSFGLTLIAVVWEVFSLAQRRQAAIRQVRQIKLLE